jgi:hypothetical protein
MKIRIENIECRFSQNRYEFIKWYPNIHFGSEAQLVAEGYELVTYPDGNYEYIKAHHHIHGSCFKHPETCYTIATISYDKNEHCTEIQSVGNRLLGLTKKERKSFFKVYEYADEQIKKEKYDNN